ncbi:MAG: hypothetical protein J6S71_10125 [Clostridia bacterium]|nr:hypothetical protein [Clostridia bacterium]
MKKKILAVALATIMIVIAVTGATLAYMKDSHKATNTFTVGNVKIELSEAQVKKDASTGNIVEDNTLPRLINAGIAYGDPITGVGNLYPAQTAHKDPTIKNIGSEDAYIAAKITISSTPDAGEKKLYDVMGLAGTDLLDIGGFVTGGLISVPTDPANNKIVDGGLVCSNASYLIYQRVEGGKYVFYIFLEGAKAKDFEQVLFTTLNIPKTWDNAEIAALKGLTIDIEAYAVQTNSFATCYAAMTTAFPTQFSFSTSLY